MAAYIRRLRQWSGLNRAPVHTSILWQGVGEMHLVGTFLALMFLAWIVGSIARRAARDVLQERDDRYAVDDRELERSGAARGE